MMQGFSGFPKKGRLIKVPGMFFSDLLPQIDHLGELKVTLYSFWRLQQKEGDDALYLRQSEFLSDEVFLRGLGSRDEERRATLLDGLERAVARGTLLHVIAHRRGKDEHLYFINTPRGREAVERIEAGEWQPGPGDDLKLDLSIERPNVFTLYEQNIGPLTPLIADRLRDLEQEYGDEWIEEAIQIAVYQGVRKLRYIEGILKRRAEEPGTESMSNQSYASGKYQDDIQS